jgi:NAD-dependent oxidoreductase involved in siderophore biosynthesis
MVLGGDGRRILCRLLARRAQILQILALHPKDYQHTQLDII